MCFYMNKTVLLY
uniref:Uncharacterized protein n=1 Tax=Anguilla anguilla TaxID=7936 RepID=A0A0E9PPT2_ANGAN